MRMLFIGQLREKRPTRMRSFRWNVGFEQGNGTSDRRRVGVDHPVFQRSTTGRRISAIGEISDSFLFAFSRLRRRVDQIADRELQFIIGRFRHDHIWKQAKTMPRHEVFFSRSSEAVALFCRVALESTSLGVSWVRRLTSTDSTSDQCQLPVP